MKRDWLGVVLAGGKSSRMGEDKSGMKLREGVTQLDFVHGLLGLFCQRVAVSARGGRERFEGFELIEDVDGVKGPMAGLIAALRKSDGKPVLLLACDMPYLDRQTLLQLVSRRDETKVATCFVGSDGMPEPLCAVYEPSGLACLVGNASQGRFSLRRFLEEELVERIHLARPDLLASVNTPDEAKIAREKLS